MLGCLRKTDQPCRNVTRRTNRTPNRRRRPGRRSWPRRLAALLLAAAPSLLGGDPARAASTGSTNLLTPQGAGAEVQFGDYITSDFSSTCTGCITGAGLNTLYRYYVEVPAGLSRLRVQIFDPDIGAGDTGAGGIEAPAQRDRCRSANPCTSAAYNTNVKYTLINPSGATVATQTCTHGSGAGFCTDNAWSSLLDTTTTPIPAGHWELDVDMSTAVNPGATKDGTAEDVNAFGIRADDGDATSGGTEIPVYYLAQNQIGQNPPATGSGTKTYTFYPYVTSGCSFNENDFDFDLNNGGTGQNVGSLNFTSRSGNFTHNLAATSLSANDVWKTNPVSGYTSASDSTDYGIWKLSAAISNYTVAGVVNGNYANVYITNSSASGAPANNSPTPNSFRVYFPTDGGAAPVKPFMEQEARYLGGSSGPNPPAVGSTTLLEVTVQVVNPTARAITFSATNLVTANVPGAGATYGGSPQVTQGTLVSQPAVNGTGNLTWNPGTLAAGATALLAYQVKVTPTSSGQLIPVVGTVASGNGTRGVWVDETGNTTQARATLTFGPLCEVTAQAGVISAAEVVDLRATAPAAHQGAGVVVQWRTVAEIAAAGFDLYREDPATHEWRQVNRSLVPALPGSPQGGNYQVLDEDAPARPSQPLRYLVVETETRGGTRRYPFQVELQAADTQAAGEAAPAAGAGTAAAGLDGSASAAGRTARRDPAWARRLAAAAAERESAPAAAPPDHVAGGGNPSLAIGVRAEGVYRIDPAVYGPALGIDKPKPLLLTSQGLPVAYTLDATGGVLFYGQASTSNYSLDNVYWLSRGPGLLMANASGGNPATTGSPTAAFTSSAHAEQETFAATTVPADPDSDYWYWDFLIAGDPADGTKSFAVAAPNATGQPGTLTVNLGAATTQNHVQVSLNGVPLGDTSWSGAVPQTATFSAPGFDPGGSNTVQLTAVQDPGAGPAIVYVQSFDAGYPRTYTAAGDALAFTGAGNAPVTVSGFSGPAIRLFDVTNPRLPAVVGGILIDTAGGVSRVTLNPATATTRYFAAGPAAVRPPQWVKPVASSLAALQPGGADYLVLTTADLLPAAGSLAALRAAQGLRTAVVDVAEVMNAFNFGLSSPHAIQAFLKFVRASWNPAPRYVLLAGAGNFDYRNVLGLGGNLVPPLMTSTPDGIYSADNLYSAGKGDGVPDFAIGRLPVVSNAELQAYVAKVAAYEATPGGGWIGQALMLADEVGPNDGVTDYVADSNDLAGTLPPGYAPQLIAVTPAGIGGERAALFGGLAAGAGLVNYFGHAGLDRLSPEGLLTTGDVPTMTNGPRLPLLTALTCNVNRFDVPGFSPLGELLTLQPAGGAIAVWSSSGLSVHPEGKQLGQAFTYALANPANRRLGDAVQQALHRYAALPGLAETLNLYTLLGDPAILLAPVPVTVTQGGTSTARE
jgi:Peptidase family C25